MSKDLVKTINDTLSGLVALHSPPKNSPVQSGPAKSPSLNAARKAAAANRAKKLLFN